MTTKQGITLASVQWTEDALKSLQADAAGDGGRQGWPRAPRMPASTSRSSTWRLPVPTAESRPWPRAPVRAASALRPLPSKDPMAAPDRSISASGYDLQERVVEVDRVAKVVKAGRRFSFTALVVVGDGTASSVSATARRTRFRWQSRRASSARRRTCSVVPRHGSTITHQTTGIFGSGRVFLKPASPGTGVIAGGGVRAVLELAGIHASCRSRWARRTRSTWSRRRSPASRTSAGRRRSRRCAASRWTRSSASAASLGRGDLDHRRGRSGSARDCRSEGRASEEVTSARDARHHPGQVVQRRQRPPA